MKQKPSNNKSEEERKLDEIDIKTIYLNTGGNTTKEQELNAFIFELKKQMESVMEENIKLSDENKKAKKSIKLESDNKIKTKAIEEKEKLIEELNKKVKAQEYEIESLK